MEWNSFSCDGKVCHIICSLRKLYECWNDWSFMLCKYLLLDFDLHLLHALHILMWNFSNTNINTLLSSIHGVCQVVSSFQNYKPNFWTHLLFLYIIAWPWRWGHYDPFKHRYFLGQWCCAIPQKLLGET